MMAKSLLFTLGVVLLPACATNEATYNNWEHSRIANCKQRFSPHDPQLERCLEEAQLPYDEYKAHSQKAEPKADTTAD